MLDPEGRQNGDALLGELDFFRLSFLRVLFLLRFGIHPIEGTAPGA